MSRQTHLREFSHDEYPSLYVRDRECARVLGQVCNASRRSLFERQNCSD